MTTAFADLAADLRHKTRHRRRVCRVVTLGRHWLGRSVEIHIGQVGFEESEDTLAGSFRQCRICYECL